MSLRVAIVGLGRAGRQIARASCEAGFVTSVFSRRAEALDAFVRATPAAAPVLYVPGQQLVIDAAIVVLAVSDRDIPSVASQLDVSPHQVVVHLSGATGIDALPQRPSGDDLRVAAHPLLSFSGGADDTLPAETVWGVSASSLPAEELVGAWLKALGGRLIRVPNAARTQWHLAATLASNGVYALLRAVDEILTSSLRLHGEEQEKVLAAFAALAAQSASSAAAQGVVAAATGPVVRGDATTVQRHLDALSFAPEERSLYRALGHFLIAVAEERNELPHTSLAALRVLLEGEG